MKLNLKWAAMAAALACAAGHVSAANHVDSLNREWLPLTAVTNFSWDQIDSVCQNGGEAAGACNGTLGTVDLTGWTWASRTEAVALIGEFMVAAGDNTSPDAIRSPHGYGVNGYAWASAFTAAMGYTSPSDTRTFGFTSWDYEYSWVCAGVVSCGWDSYAAASERYGGASEGVGSFFYRAAPVPEPSGIVLALAGGALLVGLQRRRARRGA